MTWPRLGGVTQVMKVLQCATPGSTAGIGSNGLNFSKHPNGDDPPGRQRFRRHVPCTTPSLCTQRNYRRQSISTGCSDGKHGELVTCAIGPPNPGSPKPSASMGTSAPAIWATNVPYRR